MFENSLFYCGHFSTLPHNTPFGRPKDNQEALTLNGTRRTFFYADGVNLFNKSINTIKQNTGLLVVSKWACL
jgi:hypothetical protein